MLPGVPDDLRSRHRLGERHRRRNRRLVFAVLLGTTFAAFGSSAGAWLGWRGVPALPGLDDAAALAQGVAPEKPVSYTELSNPEFSTEYRGAGTGIAVLPLTGGDDFGTGYVEVVLDVGRDGTVLDDVASRLGEAGWKVRREGDALGATAHGLHLAVHPSDGVGDPASGVADFRRITLELQRAEPRLVLPLALAGALGGAALAYGWLRFQPRLRGRYRTVAARAATAATVLLLPSTLLATAGLVLRLVSTDAAETVSRDSALALGGLRPVTVLGLAALALALATPLVAAADRLVREHLASRR